MIILDGKWALTDKEMKSHWGLVSSLVNVAGLDHFCWAYGCVYFLCMLCWQLVVVMVIWVCMHVFIHAWWCVPMYLFRLTVKKYIVYEALCLLPVHYASPLCRPCLLSSGHRPRLRASVVLWLSINSGVWSISLQLLQKNWTQRAMLKSWLGLVFNKRSFFLFYCGHNVQYSLLNQPLRPRTKNCLHLHVYQHPVYHSLFLPFQTQVSRNVTSTQRFVVSPFIGGSVVLGFDPFSSPPADHLISDPLLRIDWHSCHSGSGEAFPPHL